MAVRHRDAYWARLHRVTDHIDAHLFEPLTLEELARIACFSPHHFHRVFSAMVGETLHAYITRLRIEKAASLLVGDMRTPVTTLAMDCGFSSPSVFARAFRAHFGMTATDWRAMSDAARAEHRKDCTMERKDAQTVRKLREAQTSVRFYLHPTSNTPTWELHMKTTSETRAGEAGPETLLRGEVQVLDFQDKQVAYVRHVGPYQGDPEVFERAWSKVMAWAGMHGIMQRPEFEALCVYHDNPGVTEPEKLRISVCVTAPEDTPLGENMGRMVVAGGRYAVGSFILGPHEYAAAWQSMYGGWLPDSGFVPDDRPCLEQYAPPGSAPEGKHAVRICIPVRPA